MLLKQQDKDLFQTWGDWLSEFHWDVYATLTFRDSPKRPNNYVSPQYGDKCFRQYIEALETKQGNRLYWVRVSEVQRAREVIHYHALLGGISEANTSFLEQTWYELAGIAKVEPYNPEEKAAFYISKSMDTMDFSDNLRKPKQ